MKTELFSLIVVAGGGALGATCRFLSSTAVNRMFGSAVPLGTVAVNVLGSFLLGLLLGSNTLPEHWRLALGVGFLGSFTTFSTFSVDTVRLIQQGDLKVALINVSLHIALGFGAAALGLFTMMNYNE